MKDNCELVKLSATDAAYVNEIVASGAFDSASDYITILISNDREAYSDSSEDNAKLEALLEQRSRGPFLDYEPEKFLKEFQESAARKYGEG